MCMYRKEVPVKIDVVNYLGWNKQAKTRFDKLIKDKKEEFCKQAGWKKSECVVETNTNITITFKQKLKEEEQTLDIKFGDE